MLPWLGGVTLISWLGGCPALHAGNQGVLDFAGSAIALLVLSAIVYVLAHRFRLSPGAAERHVLHSQREAEVTEQQLAD